MTAPSRVCAQQGFSIDMQADRMLYVQLEYSINGGSSWVNTNIIYGLTTSDDVTWSYTFQGISISQTTRYRLVYSDSYDLSNPSTYEKTGGLEITLYPKPIIANEAPITTCSGTAFTDTPLPGGSNNNVVPSLTTYTWSVASNSNLTGWSNQSIGQSAISQTLVNTTIVSQTITYTVTPKSSDGCFGSTFKVFVTVNPIATISNINDQVCSGSSYQNNFSSISGAMIPAATTYNWTFTNNSAVNNESSGTSSATSFTQALINTSNSTQTVTYSITPNSGTCLGTTFSINLGVKPKPYVSTQSTSICSNSSFNFSPTNGGIGSNIIPSGTTYTWVYQNNSSVTGQVNQSTPAGSISGTITNISNPQTTQVQSYTITPTANGCDGSTFQANVTILPNALIRDKTPANICSGGTLGALNIFNGDADGDVVPNGTNYTWVISTNTSTLTGQYANANPSSQFAQNNPITNSGNVNESLVYTVTAASAGCSPTTFLVNLTVVPVAVINPKSQTICSGNSFSITPVNGFNGDIVVAGTTYTWTNIINTNIQGASSTSTPTTPISQVLENRTNGVEVQQYNVTSVSNSCAATSFSVTITVNPKPTIANYPIQLCSGSGFSFDPNTVNGNIVPAGTIYAWNYSSNVNITGQSSGTYTATLSNISQNPLTNTSSATQTSTYTVTPRVTINGMTCPGSSFTIPLTINPMPFVQPIVAPDICSGSSMTITPTDGSGNIVPNGIKYAWTSVSNNNISGQYTNTNQNNIYQSSLANLTKDPQTISYTVTPSTVNCTGSTFTITQLVKPVASIVSTTISSCSGSTFSYTPDLPNIIPDNTLYTWTIASSTVSGTSLQSNAQSLISQLLTNNTSTTKSANYLVTPQLQNGCASSSFTLTVDVNPAARIADKTNTICSGSTFSIVPTNSGSEIVPTGTLYNWTVPVNTNLTGQSTVGTYTNTIGQTLNNLTNSQKQILYTITPISNNCLGGSFSATITVNPTPVIAAKSTPICSGTSFAVTPADASPTEIVPSGITYSWTVVNNANTIGESGVLTPTSNTISQTITNSSNQPHIVAYTITPVAVN